MAMTALLFAVPVLVNGMEQRQVAEASAIEAEIHRTGAVALHGITFETGSATLLSGSDKILREIVKLLEDRRDWRFEVQGHTDNIGGKAANLALSEQRAQAVVDWLTRNGIAASRLVAKGYGDTAPLSDNATEEGRAKNRRIELKKLNEE
jgi:OmpA-OmpF porin, OOP family